MSYAFVTVFSSSRPFFSSTSSSSSITNTSFIRPFPSSSPSSPSTTRRQFTSTRRWTCISPPSPPPPPAPTPPSPPPSSADPFSNNSTSSSSTPTPIITTDPSASSSTTSTIVPSTAPVFHPLQQQSPLFPARERITTALACTAGVARAVIDTNQNTLLPLSSSSTAAAATVTSALKVTLPSVGTAALAVALVHVFAVGVHHALKTKCDGQQQQQQQNGKFTPALVGGVIGIGIVAKMFEPMTLVLYCIGMVLSIVKPMFQRSSSGITSNNAPTTTNETSIAVPVPTDIQGPLSCLRSLTWNMLFYTVAKTALGGSVSFTAMTHLLSSVTPTAAPFLFLFVAIMVFTAASTIIFRTNSSVKPNRTVGMVHALLGMGYAGAVLGAGLTPQGMFHRTVFGVGHTALGLGLIAYMAGVWPSSRESVKKLYGFIGTLMQAEYLLFPFI